MSFPNTTLDAYPMNTEMTTAKSLPDLPTVQKTDNMKVSSDLNQLFSDTVSPSPENPTKNQHRTHSSSAPKLYSRFRGQDTYPQYLQPLSFYESLLAKPNPTHNHPQLTFRAPTLRARRPQYLDIEREKQLDLSALPLILDPYEAAKVTIHV
jgi:hypothetical protein